MAKRNKEFKYRVRERLTDEEAVELGSGPFRELELSEAEFTEWIAKNRGKHYPDRFDDLRVLFDWLEERLRPYLEEGDPDARECEEDLRSIRSQWFRMEVGVAEDGDMERASREAHHRQEKRRERCAVSLFLLGVRFEFLRMVKPFARRTEGGVRQAWYARLGQVALHGTPEERAKKAEALEEKYDRLRDKLGGTYTNEAIYDMIGEDLGISGEGVRKRLQRARKKRLERAAKKSGT